MYCCVNFSFLAYETTADFHVECLPTKRFICFSTVSTLLSTKAGLKMFMVIFMYVRLGKVCDFCLIQKINPTKPWGT